jgi:hypothetical protein
MYMDTLTKAEVATIWWYLHSRKQKCKGLLHVFIGRGCKEGRDISVTGREGPYDCETSKLPHFL